MAGDASLELKSVEIDEEGESYILTIFPLLRSGASLVLSSDLSGAKVIREWSGGSFALKKSELAGAMSAFLHIRRSGGVGTAVKVYFNRPGLIRLELKDGGRLRIVCRPEKSLPSSKKISVKLYDGESRLGQAYIEGAGCECSLPELGADERGTGVYVCRFRFSYKDNNDTQVFFPEAESELCLNPPSLLKITADEERISFRLEAEAPAKAALVARLQRDGASVSGDLETEKQGDGSYMISVKELNLDGGSYVFCLYCRTRDAYSYPGVPVELIMRRPKVMSCTAAEADTVRAVLNEKCYCAWGDGQYGYRSEITLKQGEENNIRLARKAGGITVLGPPALISGAEGERCFRLVDGCFYCPGQEGDVSHYELKNSYKAFKNGLMEISGKGGGWALDINIGRDKPQNTAESFFECVDAVADTYEKLEELSGFACRMPLRPDEMAAVRYGFDSAGGQCDIRGGMGLALSYGQYQNIPGNRTDREEEDDKLSDLNLSGFTGNGSDTFNAVVRGGSLTFEPFAASVVGAGGMQPEAPQLEQSGRLGQGSGIYDLMFEQFRQPFVKIVFPVKWSGCGNYDYGSMFYYDSICLIASDSYRKLNAAAKALRNQYAPCDGAAYVHLRGRTEARLLINVFVEGSPVVCPLGTTLGDIEASYGLAGGARLERFVGDGYAVFPVASGELPLYIGDKICRKQ